jgi:acyl carrier protein
LIAYVKPEEDVDDRYRWQSDLKKALLQVLPDYMVPAMYVLVSQWPLTPSGKVNKQRLPEVDVALQSEYIAPANQTEQTLAMIWVELMGLEEDKIGRTANFFELGGHSLQVMRLIAAVKNRFNVHIYAFLIYESQTLELLAKVIELESKKMAENSVFEQLTTSHAPSEEQDVLTI